MIASIALSSFQMLFVMGFLALVCVLAFLLRIKSLLTVAVLFVVILLLWRYTSLGSASILFR